jgi:CRISPR-associated endoribonuclease Cas6
MSQDPNLLSLVLELKPLATGYPDEPEKPLPRWWGRACHALLLNTVGKIDSTLAADLHSSDSVLRPFTASTLIGSFPQGQLDRDYRYTLRMSAIGTDLTAALRQATGEGGPLCPGATVELDYIPFQILSLNPPLQEPSSHPTRSGDSPWAGLTSFQAISAPYLLAEKKAPRRVKLLFTSPTTFKSGGMHIPVPMPDWVFNSLLDCWNDFSPVVFPPEVRRYARECLAISRYELSSGVVPIKSGGVRIGGKGKITYTTLNYDRYWMSVIHTLASFALYAGVGSGTSLGLGQCRKV